MFERYVAIGDSTTEGLDDPDGAGGYRGWADRLAERIGGSLRYANLGVRGKITRAIRAEQLAPAVAMRPDLATVVAGMNDLLRRDFDAEQVAGDIGAMQRALIAGGAVVVSFTIPDLSRRLPVRGALPARTTALNRALRTISAATGARLLDLAAYDVASDPRLWAIDRLHANTAGHTRIAEAVAFTLGLPGATEAWRAPLPTAMPPARLAADLAWAWRYVVPWLWRRARGRTAGDRVTAKRPGLVSVGRG